MIDSITRFLNPQRLRDYPRLMLIAVGLILSVNLLLHQGWIGAFGQVIGGDFIMFYSTGSIYKTSPPLIYDFETQSHVQTSLVAPTILPGYNPFMNPPYTAPLYSLLTVFPLSFSLALWSVLSIGAVFAAVYALIKLLPVRQGKPILGFGQLVVLSLSFFPFIEGLLAGQNHWLTLLLFSGVVFFMYREKWFISGALAGLLLYKPQYVIGFLIIWLIWGRIKSLISFALVGGVWIGSYLWMDGMQQLTTYFQMSRIYMLLPYMPGFPRYLLMTLYGFLTSLFPESAQSTLSFLSEAIFILGVIALGWYAWKLRKKTMTERIPAIVCSIMLPLLASPYSLLHDMVVLIPAFILCMIYAPSRELILTTGLLYLGAFLLTFLAAITKIAWMPLLLIAVFLLLLLWVFPKHKLFLQGQTS